MSDLHASIERMNERYRIATDLALESYESDDVQIVHSEVDAGGWFVESVDGGYWVEARVWVPADTVEERLDSGLAADRKFLRKHGETS